MIYPFRKRSYKVAISRPSIHTPVTNILTGTTLETSETHPFIVRGVLGEEWVASRYEILRDYKVTEYELTGLANMPLTVWSRAGDRVYWAELIYIGNGESTVLSGDGNTYILNSKHCREHLFGDYIVRYDRYSSTCFVVNGKVFTLTYELAEDLCH